MTLPPSPRYRRLALDMLRSRRRWPDDADEWDWRTRTARKYVRLGMGLPLTRAGL